LCLALVGDEREVRLVGSFKFLFMRLAPLYIGYLARSFIADLGDVSPNDIANIVTIASFLDVFWIDLNLATRVPFRLATGA
jgi:hypothetical protein